MARGPRPPPAPKTPQRAGTQEERDDKTASEKAQKTKRSRRQRPGKKSRSQSRNHCSLHHGPSARGVFCRVAVVPRHKTPPMAAKDESTLGRRLPREALVGFAALPYSLQNF